ncbi:MAG TPA: M56 family metallopeptidase [Actinomycetota bacterium]|nr:M56 family metallopeptidase [Actinomycetota bacterium]
MIRAAPTILSVEPDSAWVVIFAVSFVTLVAAWLLRRVIGRPGGLASGAFLALPLVLPLLAAVAFAGSALPEIAVLQPTGRALRDGSGDLLHLLLLADSREHLVVPYALHGSAGSWLLVVGLGVTSFMLVRRLVGIVVTSRLRRNSVLLPVAIRGRVALLIERLAGAAGLRKVPEVRLLPEGVTGAFAVGGTRSLILISNELVESLDAAEFEAILAHEIAHLQARDSHVLVAAGVLRDLMAWNPVAHLSYRRLAMDRELEADRRAAEMTGQPLAVASSLLKVCEMVKRSRLRPRLVVAFFKPRAAIKRRVAQLLALADGRTLSVTTGNAPYVAAAALVAILGLQAGARIASQDSHALAIMWGRPVSTAETFDFRALYSEAKSSKRARLAASLEPRIFARLTHGATLRNRDIDEWFRAINQWTRKEQPRLRQRWESRQDWRAVPLFSDLGGPFDFYTIEKQPL